MKKTITITFDTNKPKKDFIATCNKAWENSQEQPNFESEYNKIKDNLIRQIKTASENDTKKNTYLKFLATHKNIMQRMFGPLREFTRVLRNKKNIKEMDKTDRENALKIVSHIGNDLISFLISHNKEFTEWQNIKLPEDHAVNKTLIPRRDTKIFTQTLPINQQNLTADQQTDNKIKEAIHKLTKESIPVNDYVIYQNGKTSTNLIISHEFPRIIKRYPYYPKELYKDLYNCIYKSTTKTKPYWNI